MPCPHTSTDPPGDSRREFMKVAAAIGGMRALSACATLTGNQVEAATPQFPQGPSDLSPLPTRRQAWSDYLVTEERADRTEEYAERDGLVGHSQNAARARDDVEPAILRRGDFNAPGGTRPGFALRLDPGRDHRLPRDTPGDGLSGSRTTDNRRRLPRRTMALWTSSKSLPGRTSSSHRETCASFPRFDPQYVYGNPRNVPDRIAGQGTTIYPLQMYEALSQARVFIYGRSNGGTLDGHPCSTFRRLFRWRAVREPRI